MLAPGESSAAVYNFTAHYGATYNISKTNNVLNPTNGHVCAINDNSVDAYPIGNRKTYGFTKRIVVCVKETILLAVSQNLGKISDYFAKTVAVMCVLAVMIWAVQMLAGMRPAPTREVFILGIKIGLVIMFTSNFASSFFDPGNGKGGLFGMMLNAMEDMLKIVISYTTMKLSFSGTCYPMTLPKAPITSPIYVLSVWDTIDCMLDTLMGGIFSPLTLTEGIIGFIIGAFFSSVLGFFVAILGFILIAMLLIAVARAVYIFISSYIAFAFMVLVSPMFIPLVLFKSTKAYFEKWLRVTIGFILQPIFVFAYLSMLVATYDVLVFSDQTTISLYRAIAGYTLGGDTPLSIGKLVSYNGGFTSGDKIIGQTAFNLNYKQILSSCNDKACETGNTMSKKDSGTLGTIGQEVTKNVGLWQQDVYGALGDSNIFRTGIPVKNVVDWESLLINSYRVIKNGKPEAKEPEYSNIIDAWNPYKVCLDNPGLITVDYNCQTNPDPLNYKGKYLNPYMIKILLSLIMAVISAFIFMSMLQYLPFIGSGISGESLSMPTFGAKGLAPPGSDMLGGIQKKIADKILPGRG